METMTLLRPETRALDRDVLGRLPPDSYLSPRPALTAQEVVRAIVDQHPAEREIPALVAMVLAQIPSDHRSRQQALQQLLAAEIRRCISGADTRATDVGMEVASEVDDDQGGEMKPTKRHGQGNGQKAAGSRKWAVVAAVANDPLQALVIVAGTWHRWRDLTADDLRCMAREAEDKASAILERVVKLEALAHDMDAARVSILAELPDAAERVEALP